MHFPCLPILLGEFFAAGIEHLFNERHNLFISLVWQPLLRNSLRARELRSRAAGFRRRR